MLGFAPITSPRGCMEWLALAFVVFSLCYIAWFFLAPATAVRDKLDTVREHVATVMQPVWLDAPAVAGPTSPAAQMRKALASTSLLPALGTVPVMAATARKAAAIEALAARPHPEPVVSALAHVPLADRVLFERTHIERLDEAGWRPGTGGDGLPHLDEPETVTKTRKSSRDVFGNDGADESWADVLHNAPEGEIVRRGVSVHEGPDALTVDEIEDAWYGAKFQALDAELERQRHASNVRLMAEMGPGVIALCNELVARDAAEAARHDANILAAEIELADMSGELVLAGAQ